MRGERHVRGGFEFVRIESEGDGRGRQIGGEESAGDAGAVRERTETGGRRREVKETREASGAGGASRARAVAVKEEEQWGDVRFV